tara:strand:+ start:36 stop:836 length:801 start_codon:yes stop_codon:yes gene_type:complete
MSAKQKQRPPKVYKVTDPEPSQRFDDIHPHLPSMPSLLLIIGSVRSAKSNLICNLLMNPEMFKDRFDIVKVISTTLHQDHKGKLLNRYFDATDHYDDQIIEDIKKSQSQYVDTDRPTYCLVLDDVLTQDFSKSNAVSFFSTRFRHYIDMYVIATQSFRAVSGLIRNNATDIIITKQQNQKELLKIMEEYGSLFPTNDGAGDGEKNLMAMYRVAHKERFSFLYLKLSLNPPECYVRFEEKLYPLAGGTFGGEIIGDEVDMEESSDDD